MNQWFYLAFGFGLLFIWLRKGDSQEFSLQAIREIWLEAFGLALAVGILVLVTSLLNSLLWRPSGRDDLGLISLFLWALLIDEGIGRLTGRGEGKEKIRIVVPPSFLALVGFSLWILEGERGFPSPPRFLWGLGLPLGMGLFEWLLCGLRERVKLSHIPSPLEGTPILFWLAMLLSLAFGGLAGAATGHL